MELKEHFEFGIANFGLRIEEKAENSGVRGKAWCIADRAWGHSWNDGMLGRESEAELNDAGRRRRGEKGRRQRTQIDHGELRISNLEIG